MKRWSQICSCTSRSPSPVLSPRSVWGEQQPPLCSASPQVGPVSNALVQSPARSSPRARSSPTDCFGTARELSIVFRSLNDWKTSQVKQRSVTRERYVICKPWCPSAWAAALPGLQGVWLRGGRTLGTDALWLAGPTVRPLWALHKQLADPCCHLTHEMMPPTVLTPGVDVRGPDDNSTYIFWALFAPFPAHVGESLSGRGSCGGLWT